MSHMLALGPFPFGVSTAGFESLRRAMQFKHAAAVRVGQRDSFQPLGPGEEAITITGIIAPEVTGQLASITQLEKMGQGGAAYVLVDGTGYVYGVYHIDSLESDRTHHMDDGTPQRVGFTLALTRNDATPADEESQSTKAATR